MKKKAKTKPKSKSKAKPKSQKKIAGKAKSKTLKKVVKEPKPIGRVTHFFGHIKVATAKFKQPVKIGTNILIQGATTKFSQKIGSLQYDHQPIRVAKKNKEVGFKVAKRVREGDLVYLAK